MTLRWCVGDVEIIRVEEVITPVPREDLVPELTLDEIDDARHWADPYVTSSGLLLLSVHSFVVRCGDHVSVIDTCSGVDPARPIAGDPTFLDRLADEIDGGLDAVRTVLCTHLHFDHVGWNTLPDPAAHGGRRPTFPNARYLFGRAELPATGDDVLDPAIRPLLDADLVDLIEGGREHEIVSNQDGRVWTVPTPGHTPGHVSVLIESRGDRAMITGDVFHSPVQIAHTNRFAKFDRDRDEATRSRERVVADALDRDLLVLGTHFPPPTAGHIRTGARGVEFVG